MPQKLQKPKYQIDLLDEKRAFVVIALSDKLKQPGKLVAMNALAHYNSEHGYSWASVPMIAVECGYSATSTKTINAGLNEIERVGAFKIVRTKGGGAKNTHRICPIIPWFRAEYDLLRESGKIANDNDDFADVRSGSEPRSNESSRVQDPSQSGLVPGSVGFETRVGRVQDPTKRTEETNKPKRTNRNVITPASGERVPAGLDVCSDPSSADASQAQPVNDNEANDKFRKAAQEVWLMFLKAPVKQHEEFIQLFIELAQAGEIENSTEVKHGLRCHLRDVLEQYQKSPVNFLKHRVWKDYRQRNSPHDPWAGLNGKRTAAI
jgi:hypothetical protein